MRVLQTNDDRGWVCDMVHKANGTRDSVKHNGGLHKYYRTSAWHFSPHMPSLSETAMDSLQSRNAVSHAVRCAGSQLDDRKEVTTQLNGCAGSDGGQATITIRTPAQGVLALFQYISFRVRRTL